jgi:hypothetical protein
VDGFDLVSVKDAEILRDQLFVVHNVAGAAGEHAASGIEDDRLVGDLERQFDILFDQNDRLSVRFQAPDGAADFRDVSGARPSDGSSSSSTRGLPISARPIASICCSPPDSVPANCAWRSRKPGNIW